jgi:hypothetical protein
MNANQLRAIREDFVVWSGGFPPDSDHEIFAYIEAAMPFNCGHEDARMMLKAWMVESSLPEPLLLGRNRQS